MLASLGNQLGTAFAFESITVADTAIGGTAATYQVSGERDPVAALVSVETASIRVRVDGSDPTASVGHEYLAGSSFLVTGADVANLSMIRTGATSATVRVTYFR